MKLSFLAAVALLAAEAIAYAQPAPGQTPEGFGMSFKPDFTFEGSTLAGWHPLGGAEWRAKDGEITGVSKEKSAPGWLVLDRSYQDVGFRAVFKFTPGIETGILFRIEKSGNGRLRCLLVSITDQETAFYRVVLGSNGQELTREKLRSAVGIVRMAPPPETGKKKPPKKDRPLPPDLPIVRPKGALQSGQWNQIEVFLDWSIIRAFLNDGKEIGGATEDNGDGYGPLALYIGGPGEVRFRNIGEKDLARKTMPAEETSPRFRAQRLSDMYYSWSAASADFDRDGHPDVVAGPYIYFGPDFTVSREIYPATPLNPAKDFAEVNCQYAYDFNGDGWPDVLVGSPSGTLYLNPKGESRRWEKHNAVPAIQTEVTLFQDLDGDGKPELIFGSDGFVCYAKPDPADPAKPWIVQKVSGKGYAMAHGLGVGDLNGDGRMDILNPNGWWEQPAPGTKAGDAWKYHSEAFARYGHRSTNAGGSVMGVYDVNGDGWNDVVTALNAHGFGLAWFEQKRDAAGKISFVRHLISDDYSARNPGDVTFSQPHGSAFADVDGDGLIDFIVGKRYWSHLYSYLDPDPYGPPVLYWYRAVRNPQAPGGAEFVPELIHNRSGAGSDILAADLNQDGAVDVVTSTDRGTFIFWNQEKSAKPAPLTHTP